MVTITLSHILKSYFGKPVVSPDITIHEVNNISNNFN